MLQAQIGITPTETKKVQTENEWTIKIASYQLETTIEQIEEWSNDIEKAKEFKQ